jgi:hypothetical protein
MKTAAKNALAWINVKKHIKADWIRNIRKSSTKNKSGRPLAAGDRFGRTSVKGFAFRPMQ